jgi:Immunity protein 64
MGSYISIGLVYDKLDTKTIEIELKKITKYFTLNKGKILNIKFCKDENCEEWVEYSNITESSLDSYYSQIVKGYFGQIDVECDLLGITRLKLTIRVQRESDYFGFLIDIEEDVLIGERPIEQLNSITEKIITFIIGVYDEVSYSYAFCEHEGEILYSPKIFHEISDQIYSVVVLPLNEGFKIHKSSWNIDGLTERN